VTLVPFVTFLIVALGTLAIAQVPPPSPILLEQRQREVVLVRHLRQHAADPSDGLALSADRRDLQRLRSMTPLPLAPLSSSATDDELVDAVRVLTDLWYARVVERTPFGMMSRDRLAGLTQLQRAVGQLQSRGRRGLETWLLQVQEEVAAMLRIASGQGEVNDATVDFALQIADAAAAGRPMIGPGAYPAGGGPAGVTGPAPYPGPGPYAGTAPPGPGPGPGPGPAPYPPGAPYPPSGAYAGGPPVTSGPTPYTLPPGYEAYSAGAAGAGGLTACQTLRTAAGVSQGVSDMMRAAECWTRTPTWPGWGAQALEALDWAVNLAVAERQCTALQSTQESLRELGPRLSAGGLTPSVAALVRTAETEHRRLRSQGLCR
jgi:hypothetical protein